MAAKASVSAVWRSSQQSSNPPSCTFVAGVTESIAGQVNVAIAWLGDSRAYWVGIGTDEPAQAQLLTTDHSWAQEQLGLGELEPDVIASDPRAHSITRWIGVDAGDVTPEVAEYSFAEPGRLIVCSDGLWNYAPEPEEMAALIDERTADATPTSAELAEALVAFANDSGGHDNITVLIADFTGEPADPADPATEPAPEIELASETEPTDTNPEDNDPTDKGELTSG